MEYAKIIPFEKIEKIACVMATGKGELAGTVRKRTGADIVINAPVFDMANGRILSSFVCNGIQCGRDDGLRGFRFDGGMARLAWSGVGAGHFVSEFGLLVSDGKVRCSVSASPNSRRGRTAIGYTEQGELVLYVVTDTECYAAKKTAKQLAEKMLSLGCVQAINLDGGGSSQIADKTGAYTAGRPVPGFIAVWLKETEEDTMTVRATKKICTLDAKGNKECGRYIAKGDICEVTKTITDALLVEIEYPVSGGRRTAYVRSLEGLARVVSA